MVERIEDVTGKNKVNGDDLLTLFPMQWVAFVKHAPDSDVYDGDENHIRGHVLEMFVEREYPIGKLKDKLRLEIWWKGGDWNENPFVYFCVGEYTSDGELYFIPQLSPKYKDDSREEEVVEVPWGLDNFIKFIKERFFGADGEVNQEFKQCEVNVYELVDEGNLS